MHRTGPQPQRSARHHVVARTRTAVLPVTKATWNFDVPCMAGIGDLPQGDAAP